MEIWDNSLSQIFDMGFSWLYIYIGYTKNMEYTNWCLSKVYDFITLFQINFCRTGESLTSEFWAMAVAAKVCGKWDVAEGQSVEKDMDEIWMKILLALLRFFMFENKLHVVCIKNSMVSIGIPSIHVLDVCSGLCLICSFDTSSSKCVDFLYQHLHLRHYPQTCANLQALGGCSSSYQWI